MIFKLLCCLKPKSLPSLSLFFFFLYVVQNLANNPFRKSCGTGSRSLRFIAAGTQIPVLVPFHYLFFFWSFVLVCTSVTSIDTLSDCTMGIDGCQ